MMAGGGGSGLAVEGSHGHGLGHHPLHHFAHHAHTHAHAHPHHMAFGAPPVPEFLRPLPKPAPLVPRYNGSTSKAATSVVSSLSAGGIAPSPGPVNLASSQQPQQQSSGSSQSKDEDDFLVQYNTRLFAPPPPPFSHYPTLPGPYGSLYPAHYTPLLSRDRPTLPPPPNPPLSPLEAYPSPHSAPNSPASTYSPPIAAKSSQPSYKDRKFKVPSGKEGSLKHRILTTTAPSISTATTSCPTAPPTPAPAAAISSTTSIRFEPSIASTPKIRRKGSSAVSTAEASLPATGFNKGSLIQLANGDLKRVEDMRTEDFVTSAERSSALRLDPSTVVRIEPSPTNKSVNILTLSYGERKSQVEMESAIEHPYFVYGQGWASCSPEKTLAVYGLRCHRLQIGDVCISLSPRPSSSSSSSSGTNHDTPTATAATPSTHGTPDAIRCKKRRWSAPDQFEPPLLIPQPPQLPLSITRLTND